MLDFSSVITTKVRKCQAEFLSREEGFPRQQRAHLAGRVGGQEGSGRLGCSSSRWSRGWSRGWGWGRARNAHGHHGGPHAQPHGGRGGRGQQRGLAHPAGQRHREPGQGGDGRGWKLVQHLGAHGRDPSLQGQRAHRVNTELPGNLPQPNKVQVSGSCSIHNC